ncbi:hypothetical protein PsorP6_006235 [Peronosclerospora sorghi]|uniref:Uncharacterized protein n=1 Tax=Peronosclerospora sorghi TaxID=230839 RepID=A0ACC0W732_9STRA|nr:hypothetical protein PsorP6_006235 [Peronosclerospora sorghi]
MRGSNADLLSGMSDVSDMSVSSDDEVLHIMDPSDPRAHRPVTCAVLPPRTLNEKNLKPSRWDSDDDDGGEPITNNMKNVKDASHDVIEIHDDDSEPEVQKERVGVTLSKWAQARFLAPVKERKTVVLENPPLETINDFILSDFGSRYRGEAGNVVLEKDISVEDEGEPVQSTKKQVGAPLFDTSTQNHTDADGADKKEKSKQKNTKKEDGRKRKENRYFITDLATKCYHCGKVGHMANVCTNDKLHPPCYYCALRGHQSWECPNLPCANCLQLGHQETECNNRRLTIESCELCGRPGHMKDRCHNVGNQEHVTCMVCTKVGHLHCVPLAPPSDRRVYCPNCAGNHTVEECRKYLEPAATNFATRIASGRSVQTCFVCNESGHVAVECPMRSDGYSRGGSGCFKCGKFGHFAADCHNSNSNYDSGRQRAIGRKRGRDVVHDYDYDEGEDYYSHDRSSQVGSKTRSFSRTRRNSSTHGYVRLQEALPTSPYRNSRNYGERRHSLRR